MGDPGVGGGMFGGCAEVVLLLFGLWIVSLLCGPGRISKRERKRGREEREGLERWSARSVRMDLTDAEWQELQDAR